MEDNKLKDLEKIAYESVSNIPTLEKNDNFRLGYHIYYYLLGKIESIEEAIKVSRPRTTMSKEEMIKIIEENLSKNGIKQS